MNESHVYDVFETEMGWIALSAGEKGVTHASLPENSPEKSVEFIHAEIAKASFDPQALHTEREAIVSYCKGNAVNLSEIKVDFDDAAPFFKRAWQACRTIPRGSVRTYRWIAAAAGNPLASRAAGQAMARNRIPLVVPCHRVIGSDGSLHGFGGGEGLSMKGKLLSIEGGHILV